MERVVIYCRVSTLEEEQLNALKDQIKELEGFTNDNPEWILVDRYIDEGKTGTSATQRKEYKRLYGDLESDKFDIILIKDETRLNRDVFEWYKFKDKMIKNNKKLYYYMDKKFYSAEDIFLIGIKAMMAEQYSRDLSKKINNAHKSRQKRGKVCTNSRILGYDLINGELVVNEKQAEIIKYIYNRYCDGIGFKTISKELFEKGITNEKGNKYDPTSLQRMVMNEKYKGVLVSNKKHKDFETKVTYKIKKEDWIVKEDVIPAIVSRDVWEKANSILNLRRQTYINKDNEIVSIGYKDNSSIYTGKIICGSCGKKYWHQARKNCRHDVWQCSKFRREKTCSNKIQLSDEILDNLMREIINNFLKNKSEYFKEIIEALNIIFSSNKSIDKINSISLEKDKYEKLKNNLIDMMAEGLITKDEYITKKIEYDEKIIAIEEELSVLNEKNINIVSKKQRLDQLELLLIEYENDPTYINDDIISNLLEKIIVNENNELEVFLNVNLKYLAKKNDDIESGFVLVDVTTH